jgi:hypothetical protein
VFACNAFLLRNWCDCVQLLWLCELAAFVTGVLLVHTTPTILLGFFTFIAHLC